MLKKRMKIIKLLFLLVIILFFINYSNSHLDITHINYSNSKIPKSFNNYKIIQLSDLHDKSFGKSHNTLVDKVASENPNIIIITGDIIDKRRNESDNALLLVNELIKIAPIYYVNGNHEEISKIPYKELSKELRAIGVTVLDNDVAEITKENDSINIWGFKNSQLSLLKYDKNKITQTLNKNRFNILLAHKPELIDIYAELGFDLGFSGHAHGGQIRIPFTSQGLVSPGEGLLPKYTAGVHIIDDFSLIISRGLGNSLFPLRIFNNPEIISVTLQSK